MKRLAVLVFLAIFLLTGCETFSGFGRDLQKAGDWVERTAEQSR